MALRKIRNQYIALFLLISAIFVIGSAFALYQNYSLYRESQKEELIREAYASNAMLEAVLADASKILDIARPKIEQALNAGTLNKESAYQILKDSHIIFNSFAANTPLQLAVYINENGVVQATSREVENRVVDLSSRLYFTSLKNNPRLPYAIGNLVIAKTTGLLTFHIATPIVDRTGRFRGIITQQVAANDLAINLSKSLKAIAGAQILVNLQGGNIAFMYPRPNDLSEIDFRLCLYVDGRVKQQARSNGIIDIAANKEYPNRSYVAYATSDKYGLITTVSLPVKVVLGDYVRSSSLLIIFIALAFLSLVYIFWRFYKKAVVVAESLIISFSDALTGLKNRRFFDTEFPKYWKEAIRSKNPISVLFIDIDHFKIFNDDYGHDCGDQALIALARAIEQFVTRPLDFCCRWGGEEFAVILPDTDEHGAISLASEILEAVRLTKLDFPNNQHPKITVSIGIASLVVNQANTTDDLIDMADKAMYVAKQSGRDRLAVFGKAPPRVGQ
ncbi:diguanylate cyclase (GGDEF)-like protein [Polynucleobacter sphagniphilus]|uniref:sensor domain-containing diguanylate cyclase n=1 Tax=Polynucleobacter sphagniphilus TaxID=1743169 RepID=UPI0024741D01|nr:diguanylate cyclase [Polynucleobacter sphagniphilus]MDH6422197.1 diguanylate cyclase (GGDEF)-like protein [Polynucleobacter sphagniphilus]